jgi:hypothetical protein
MNQSEKPPQSVFEVVEGLTPIDEQAVEEFRRAMTDDVIPEIEKVVEERRLLAAHTRQKQLKP